MRALARTLFSSAALTMAATFAGGQAPGAAAGSGAAAARSESAVASEPGSELVIYHVVMGQGDAIWEKFGHNALWIRDTVAGTDVAYNWGVFDFAAADFISRFMRGSMRYWVDAYPALPMIDVYVQSDRSVDVQELALTPAEKLALREYVQWNVREENRYYTYDYYRDNCTTRVRDALDRVLGGRLRAMTDTVLTSSTYRWHTRRLTRGVPVIHTGIDLMLGRRTDRPLTVWEEMFLPGRFQAYLRDIAIVEPDGTTRRLVASERQLYRSQRAPEPTEPPNWLPIYALIGFALAGLVLLTDRRAAAGAAWGRAGLIANAIWWPLLAGLAGTVMLAAWLFTNHWAVYSNENLLHFTPIALALVVAAPAFIRSGRWARGAVLLATIVAGLSTIGFLLQLTPWFDQVNGPAIALALPIHLALLWVIRRRFDESATRVEDQREDARPA